MHSTEKRRRRLEALYTPPCTAKVQRPARSSIPVERQAVAAETFWASSGAYIWKGTVLVDDAEPVKAHPQYFTRPLEAV